MEFDVLKNCPVPQY